MDVISRAFGALWRHPIRTVVAASFASAAVFIDDLATLFERGNAVMVALAGPEWLSDFVGGPLWRITCLALCLAMLWWIGWSAQREAVRAAKAETEARARGLEIPVALARAAAFRHDCYRFHEAIRSAESSFQGYQRSIADYDKKKSWKSLRGNLMPSAERTYRLIHDRFIALRGVNLEVIPVVGEKPDWQVSEVRHRELDKMDQTPIFFREDNEAYFAAETRNSRWIKRLLQDMNELLQEKLDEAAQREKDAYRMAMNG